MLETKIVLLSGKIKKMIGLFNVDVKRNMLMLVMAYHFNRIKFQVSLPHYRRESFLQDSITRYRMYLYLKSKHPEKFLVPCYDIDIVWHTHQVKNIRKYFHIAMI